MRRTSSHFLSASLILLVFSLKVYAEDASAYVIDHKDIEYARIGSRPLLLNYYVPRNAQAPFPIVIQIHGGGWHSGSRNTPPKGGLALIKRGYALASIDYRLSGEARFPAQIHDCKAAVRFIRANAASVGIDPNRIGVWGTSAGGHLAALLGTTGDLPEFEGNVGISGVSSRVQAVFDVCGPANLLTLKPKTETPNTNAVRDLLGGPPSEKMELARSASPINYASADDAPFLIYHGEADALVPITQSLELATALTNAGAIVYYVPIPGAGHDVMETVTKTPQLAQGALNFFDQYLR